jgi:hypothetical protein
VTQIPRDRPRTIKKAIGAYHAVSLEIVQPLTLCCDRSRHAFPLLCRMRNPPQGVALGPAPIRGGGGELSAGGADGLHARAHSSRHGDKASGRSPNGPRFRPILGRARGEALPYANGSPRNHRQLGCGSRFLRLTNYRPLGLTPFRTGLHSNLSQQDGSTVAPAVGLDQPVVPQDGDTGVPVPARRLLADRGGKLVGLHVMLTARGERAEHLGCRRR